MSGAKGMTVAEVTAPVHSVVKSVLPGGIEPGVHGSYTRIVAPFDAAVVVERAVGAVAVHNCPRNIRAKLKRSDTRTVRRMKGATFESAFSATGTS